MRIVVLMNANSDASYIGAWGTFKTKLWRLGGSSALRSALWCDLYVMKDLKKKISSRTWSSPTSASSKVDSATDVKSCAPSSST